MYVSEAVILAGGLGTRLKDTIGEIPKPMAPVNGRPFLEYLLDYLDHFLVHHAVLSVGYKSEMIKDHFKDQYKNVKIEYAYEDKPLGTGGGIVNALPLITGSKFLVYNGDTLFRVNLDRLNEFHFSKSARFTVVLRHVEDVSRYGSVETNMDNRIIKFNEKGENRGPGKINGGVYLINKSFFTSNNFPEKFSMEKDGFEKLFETQPFHGLTCKQYFIDIGIPEDYQKAQYDFRLLEY